jgi:zinc protease
MEEVREKRGLTYGIYSQPVFMDGANYLTIISAASPENITPMKKSVQQILKKLKSTPVEATKLAEAKSYLIGSLPLRLSTTLSLSGTALRMQLDGRDLDALDQWRDKINAVTVEDVQRVANTIFQSNEPVVTVIAGAVPDNQGYDIIETLPGVE